MENASTCPLQLEANTSSTCLFTSPMSAPDVLSGAHICFAINLVSLLGLVFWLIIPNYCIKGRRLYPNNLLYATYCEMAVQHMFVFVSLVVAGFAPWSTMTMQTDGNGNAVAGAIEYHGFSKFTCTASSFFVYYSTSVIGTNCACLSTSLYASVVRGKNMKSLAKARTKAHIIYGRVGALIPVVLTLGFGKTGVYTLYCGNIFPLWTRLFFYLGLVGHGVVTVCFLVPVIRVLFGDSKKVAEVTSKSSTQGSGGKKHNAIRSATIKMAIFAVVFCLCIGGASFKRIVHSAAYASYYETPDAGKIGLTEYILMGMGIPFAVVFGVHKKNARFYAAKLGFKVYQRQGSASTVITSSAASD